MFHNLTYLRNAKAAREWEVMEGMGRGAMEEEEEDEEEGTDDK